MKNLPILLFFVLGVQGSVGQASFLPKDLHLRESDLPAGTAHIDQTQFNKIISDLQNLYAPLAKQFNGNLNFLGEWNSDKIDAGSQQVLGYWIVRISGGLARRPELIPDGVTLILCHELGHHFGGFPFEPNSPPIGAEWAAAEGQADYFSTAVCARKIWAHDDQGNAAAAAVVNPVAKQSCDRVHSLQSDRNICYRANVGVQSIMNTMAVLLKKPMPDITTPDPSTVTKTFTDHPAVQCRMDTVYQGTLCAAHFNEALIPGKNVSAGVDSLDAEHEAAATSCMRSSGFTIGLRPDCWFAPRL